MSVTAGVCFHFQIEMENILIPAAPRQTNREVSVSESTNCPRGMHDGSVVCACWDEKQPTDPTDVVREIEKLAHEAKMDQINRAADVTQTRDWQNNIDALRDIALRLAGPIDAIKRKCEQYWNEHNISDAEVHAILEFIYSECDSLHHERTSDT